MSLKFPDFFLGFLTFTTLLAGAELSWSQNTAEGEIDTLEVIEIPGTAVKLEEREFIFPEPRLDALSPFPNHDALRISAEFTIHHDFPVLAVATDQTAKGKGIRRSVKPIRTEHPPYPRFAREQGWEGTVLLRLVIGPDGKVASATTRKSSGHPILDDSAIQAVQQWTFHPAQNGEFPVTAKVDLPIRFDLEQ